MSVMEDEAQLASVVSHEVSHVVARHGMKRLQSAMIAQVGYQVVMGGSDNSELVGLGSQIGLTLLFSGYSRSAEREADRFGIHYMRLAGYDPIAAVEMFNHLARAGERDPNAFEKLVASHPDTKERIQRAERQIAEMEGVERSLKRNTERYLMMKKRLPNQPRVDSL
ncbi:MAG: M48 family metalloprotease [Candidatus Zixiibacteriota bacterium]